MTTKLRLTDAKARALPPGEYADTEERGLMLYVSATARTYGLYKWSPAERRPIRKSIGPVALLSLSEARKRARVLSMTLLDGKPIAAADPATVGSAAARYTTSKSALRHPDMVAGSIRRHAPDWLNRTLASIRKADVIDRAEKVKSTRGPVAAHTFVCSLRAIYALAIDEERFDGRNPADRVRTAPSKPRERVLTPEELVRFERALDAEPIWAPFFRLLLETGARKGNLCSARWGDIDLNAMLWRIPAEQFKTGRGHTIPLSARAVAVLRLIPRVASPFVFPSRTDPLGHVREPHFAFRRVCVAAGIESITIHDLRRTRASELLRAGAPLPVIARLLGHAPGSATTAVHYTHADEELLRQFLDRSSGY